VFGMDFKSMGAERHRSSILPPERFFFLQSAVDFKGITILDRKIEHNG